MDMLKAVVFGALLSATIGVVIGSQGTNGGPLAIHLVTIAEAKLYWSWPVFLSATGLSWGLMLLQR